MVLKIKNYNTKHTTEYVKEDEEQEEELGDIMVEESRWMEKVRCIDNSHSIAYGLDMEGFEVLYNKIMRELKNVAVDKAIEDSRHRVYIINNNK